MLESVPDLMTHDPMFARNAAGKPVTRDKACECGRSFSQRLLSERFLAIVEKQGMHTIDTFQRQVPEFFVPVFCPRCERKDIGRQARIDSTRDVPHWSGT